MHRSSKHHAVRFLAETFSFVEVRVSDDSKLIRLYLWAVSALDSNRSCSIRSNRGSTELWNAERVLCPQLINLNFGDCEIIERENIKPSCCSWSFLPFFFYFGFESRCVALVVAGELSPSWLERLGWIAIGADVVTLTYCAARNGYAVEFL